jgi:Skp family chaperone for outer membrane proteins
MKFPRLLLFPLLVTASAALLPAQSKPAAAPVAPARIAFVNSTVFIDEATGIKQLVKANQGLELEFSSTQSELSLLNEKLRTLIGELNKLAADKVANAKAIAEKQTAGQQLQQELATKQQAGQAAYSKRAQEVQQPITAEIGKELRAYAKERGVDVLIDGAKLNDALLDVKPELDLTADFIAYYNDKHP